MSSYYDDFEAPYEIYEKWTKGAKMERANKKGHDERSYDDPASGDAGDTPKTDALIEQWMRTPTPVPPEFIDLCKKLERESYSKQETNAMLAENWTRTERLLATALKENKALWDGIEAIREKQLEKPRCPVCNNTGTIDSGGQNPNGLPIMVGCYGCDPDARKRRDADIKDRQDELEKCPICDRTLIDGDWCDNHGRVNERLNPNDYR